MKPGALCRMSDKFVPVVSGVSLWSNPRLLSESGCAGMFGTSEVALVIRTKPMSDGDRDYHNHWNSLKIVTSQGQVGWIDRRFVEEIL